MRIKEYSAAICAVVVVVAVAAGLYGYKLYTGRHISYDTPMGVMFEDVMAVANEFAQEMYPDEDMIDDWVFIPKNTSVRSGCSGDMLGDDNSFYCAFNEKIYGGESHLWSLHAQSGIVGVYFVVGHEYGHHFLSRVGSVTPSRKIRSSFHNEQGADCYAGALIAYAHTRGYLSERPLSLAAQRTTMAVADPVSIQGYHGAYHERYDAYSHGATYGARACER